MPAVRLTRRRRSSLAAFTPAKAGIYGIQRPVTFAPNVTPVTFVESDDTSRSPTPEAGSPSSALFPPSQAPAPAPSRRRAPPGKRRSMGYIPRPPNAFMLFRADFVRQKHVPGSIETNHGSLSKIIGNCWRSLPLEEKRVWEVKAKHAKAEHKAQYPEYRFRPVHNKNKEKKKDKPTTTVEDERRCEEVAQLLLEGKKGDELAAAVRNLDRIRSATPAVQPVQQPYKHRRSSSVPLPNDYYPNYSNIALPSVPFLASSSRPMSPVGTISRQQRAMLGRRRSSSAQPSLMNRSWTLPMPTILQRDHSPLPEVDTSIFEPSFMNSNYSFPTQETTNPHQHLQSFNISELMTSLPHDLDPCQSAPRNGPLDGIAPHDMVPMYNESPSPGHDTGIDNMCWPLYDQTNAFQQQQPQPQSQSSHSSSTYSGSPATSEGSLPTLHAPKPQFASDQTPTSSMFDEMWKGVGAGDGDFVDHSQFSQAINIGIGIDLVGQQQHMLQHQDLEGCGINGYDNLFDQHPQLHQQQLQYENAGFSYGYNEIISQ